MYDTLEGRGVWHGSRRHGRGGHSRGGSPHHGRPFLAAPGGRGRGDRGPWRRPGWGWGIGEDGDAHHRRARGGRGGSGREGHCRCRPRGLRRDSMEGARTDRGRGARRGLRELGDGETEHGLVGALEGLGWRDRGGLGHRARAWGRCRDSCRRRRVPRRCWDSGRRRWDPRRRGGPCRGSGGLQRDAQEGGAVDARARRCGAWRERARGGGGAGGQAVAALEAERGVGRELRLALWASDHGPGGRRRDGWTGHRAGIVPNRRPGDEDQKQKVHGSFGVEIPRRGP
jgi:hypothetical protein